MQPDGSYTRLVPDPGEHAEGTHDTMMRLALARHGATGPSGLLSS
jgi:hypothetical protein